MVLGTKQHLSKSSPIIRSKLLISEAHLPQSDQVIVEGTTFQHPSSPHLIHSVVLCVRGCLTTLSAWNPISPHLLYAWLQHHYGHLVIIIYVPSEDAEPVEKDAFYHHLAEKVQSTLLVLGDFSGVTGCEFKWI